MKKKKKRKPTVWHTEEEKKTNDVELLFFKIKIELENKIGIFL